MNYTWLFWKTFVPVLGQPVLIILYMLVNRAGTDVELKIKDYPRLAFNPTGLFFFAIASYAYSIFTILALGSESPPDFFALCVLILAVAVLVHYQLVVSHSKAKGEIIPPNPLTYVTSVIAVITATFIAYRTQELFSETISSLLQGG